MLALSLGTSIGCSVRGVDSEDGDGTGGTGDDGPGDDGDDKPGDDGDDEPGDDGGGDGGGGDGDDPGDGGDGDDKPPPPDGPACGNGEKEPGEGCDGDDLGGLTCQDIGYYDGELACADCKLDEDGCVEPPPDAVPECGDGEKQPGEGCDGRDLGGVTCIDLGYTDGELACTDDCQLATDDCIWDDGDTDPDDGGKGENCGNGQLDPGETCDGDLGPTTCEELGFEGGTLVCDPSFCYLDTSRCV